MRTGGAIAAAATLLLAGCLGGGGPPPFDQCEIKVAAVEKWNQHGQGLDVAYRVQGKAGSPAEVWLVARTVSGQYVPGYAVDVGPGAFLASVDLKLTGEPKEFLAVLEVAGKRCKASAPRP